MLLSKLFSKRSDGGLQEWSIEIVGNKYRTISGVVDGKLVTSEWTVCQGKNLGRANETSPSDQAMKEAQAQWEKKLSRKYSEGVPTDRKFTPMLARTYEKGKVKFPVFSQRKYDGIRVVFTKDGPFSREGKPFFTLEHIRRALKPLFVERPDIILDGEGYSHDFHDNFNKICSLIKRQKPTPEDIKEAESLVEYHVYDVVTEGNYEARLLWLSKNLPDDDCIVQVPTQKVTNEEELNELNELYVGEGYEGQMIRLDAPYEQKRSKNLLKRKEFFTHEYKIIDITEGDGNRAGMVGRLILALGDTTFKSNIRGDREFLREMWQNKKSYIGKLAIVRMPNLTPDGVPKHHCTVGIK
jgi:DNA ligase-1